MPDVVPPQGVRIVAREPADAIAILVERFDPNRTVEGVRVHGNMAGDPKVDRLECHLADVFGRPRQGASVGPFQRAEAAESIAEQARPGRSD